MLLMKTDSRLNNANLPVLTLSDIDKQIKLLNPSLWLEGGAAYIQTTDGIHVAGWVNRSTSTRYVPATIYSPQIIAMGSSSVVRFGYKANVTDSDVGYANGGVLKPELTTEVGLLTPTFTIAAVVRMPKPKGASGSELQSSSDLFSGGRPFGSSDPTVNNCSYLNFDTSSTGTGAADYFVTGSAVFAPTGTFNDQTLHTVLMSVDAVSGTSQFYHNGVLVGSGLTVPTPAVDQSAQQILIGCLTNNYTAFPYVGDIGLMMYFGNSAVHLSTNSLNTVLSKLASVKTALGG